MIDTPVSLLERLRQPHDGAAWSRFVHLYTPLLHDWALHNGLQEADAADLLQDVFTILLRELPKFHYDAAGSFRGWLRVVWRNAWHAGGRRRHPLVLNNDVLGELPGPAAPDLPGEAEERRHLVRQALALLESEFERSTWQAFWQHAVFGRPAVDVAADLGVTANAVYIAKSRVFKRLRQELAGLLD